jgi:hypothetical protein
MRSLALILALLAAPLARGADAAADAAARSYRIETEGTSRELATGATGTLVLAIVPLDKTHVHPEAPLKITLQASKGLTLSKTQLGHKDAVDPKAEGPRFEVPFTATAAGNQEARAKVDFFICSDLWCVKQTRDVVVPVTVK